MTKKEFDETLKEIKLSRQEFADQTNMTYGAVSNWHDEKKPVPGWVNSWLQNYKKAKDMDNIEKVVKPYVKN